MKALIMFSLLAWSLPFGGHSQSIQVKKEPSTINSRNTIGYQTEILASEEEVRNYLSKYLKALGKTKQSGDYTTMAEPLVGGRKYTTTLYAAVKQLEKTTAVWMGMPSESGEESAADRDIEKLVHDFAVAYHRDKIQLQIDESLRALQAVERQQTRLVNQNKDLNIRIENNKRQKIELEKSLLNNRMEFMELTGKLVANTKAQDSVAIATEQIKKAVEMHQERQKSVN